MKILKAGYWRAHPPPLLGPVGRWFSPAGILVYPEQMTVRCVLLVQVILSEDVVYPGNGSDQDGQEEAEGDSDYCGKYELRNR